VTLDNTTTLSSSHLLFRNKQVSLCGRVTSESEGNDPSCCLVRIPISRKNSCCSSTSCC